MESDLTIEIEPLPFSDFQILKKLFHSQFSLYLAFSPSYKQYYVLKSFPYTNHTINPSYLHESQFSYLSHPNIISMLKTEDSYFLPPKTTDQISYILMEIARYDFVDLVNTLEIHKDPILVRTFFHQLINALEYLHSRNIAHMDIKPDNLLLGYDFRLKLSDFDVSFKFGDPEIIKKYSPNYQAPEVETNHCLRPMMSDIYSAGIMLFLLGTGKLPYDEINTKNGKKTKEMFREKPEQYWEYHKTVSFGEDCADEDFKELVVGMTRKDLRVRFGIRRIKKCRWYKGEVYTLEKVEKIVRKIERRSQLNTVLKNALK